MKKAPGVLLFALLLLPMAASAQVTLGLRASYGVPSGDAYENSGLGMFKQSGLASRQVPLQLDASWRLTPGVSAGLYLGYGLGQTGSRLKDLCAAPGSSCDSPTFLRYGAQAAYTFRRGASVDPWLGVSAGLQSASFAVRNFLYDPLTPRSADLKGTLRGWEAGVEGGVDRPVARSFSLGAFLAYGFGQYTVQHVTLSDQGTVAGGGVDSAKTHQWINLGLRGRYDL